MLKKFGLVVTTMMIGIMLSLSVFAQAPQPRFINDANITNRLDFSGNEAILYSEVKASSDVTKIVITHVLQVKSGSKFNDVSGTSVSRTFKDTIADMEDSFTVNGGGTYRMKTICSVTSSKGTDTYTKYSKSSNC